MNLCRLLMNRYIKRLGLMIIGINYAIASSGWAGEEVTIQHNELQLNANLEMADGKNFEDGMVLVLHGTMAHNRMEIIAAVQETLLDNELSSLAINLSLRLDNRHGFYDCHTPHRHLQDESADELEAWVAWLSSKGAKNIVLMGHSRGANQSLIYAIEHLAEEISHVILLAPGAGFSERSKKIYEARYEVKIGDVLARAEQMIQQGQGEQLMRVDFAICPQADVTANTFVSYYAANNKFSNPEKFINRSTIPTLVILGDEDELQPNAFSIYKSAIGNDLVQLEIVEGADHFFRDLNMEDAIDLAVEFISEAR